MQIYVVTGMHVDFENENYNVFEPEVFGDRQTAEAAIAEMCEDAVGEKTEEQIGHDGFSRDIEFSDHSGNLTVVKARLL